MRSKMRVRLGVTAFAFSSLLAFAAPAHAIVTIQCSVAATSTQSEISPGIYDWDVVMIGECGGDFEGKYAVFGSADGTSNGLGLCSGDLVVQDLDLTVDMFLDSTRGPVFSKTLVERWYAPITTFPVATPFLIDDISGSSPQLAGAGVLSQHVGLNCGPGGSLSTAIFSIRIK